MYNEVTFVIKQEATGFSARAVHQSIFTEADTLEQLWYNMFEATSVHYGGDDKRPRIVVTISPGFIG